MLFNQIFQFMVLAQPVIWSYVYYSSMEVERERTWDAIIYLGFASVFVWLLYSGFQVEFYVNHLLLMYTFLTIAAYTAYRCKFTVTKALSMAFLTIYLNSYFWELPMHIAEYLSFSFYPAQLQQIWRLSPIMLFRQEFREIRFKYIKIGIVVSSVLFWCRFYRWTPWQWSIYIMHLNRLICAYLLIRTLLEAKSSYDLE